MEVTIYCFVLACKCNETFLFLARKGNVTPLLKCNWIKSDFQLIRKCFLFLSIFGEVVLFCNLYDGSLPHSEWKKNLRMDRDVFMSPANEIRLYIQNGRSTKGLVTFSSKAAGFDFVPFKRPRFKDHFLWQQMLLGLHVARFLWLFVKSVSSGQGYIKLLSTEQDMNDLVEGMENKYGFPQAWKYAWLLQLQTQVRKKNTRPRPVRNTN